jgi:hypothetical protein
MKISKSLPTFIAEQFVYSLNDIVAMLTHYDFTGGTASSQVSAEVKENAEKVSKFTNNIWGHVNRGEGFLTIFKSAEKRMKVNDVNGLACVMTTGMLKQLTQAYVSVIASGVYTRNTYDSLPSVKVVVDILRYIEELELGAIEFSMRSLRTSPTSRIFDSNHATFLSDRYQKESWKQHLKTDYPNYDTSGGSDFPTQVALAEMNIA